MDRLDFALEAKLLEAQTAADSYTITGYASVFGNKDMHSDIVVKGAFAESLRERTPALLFGHDMKSLPIGLITKVAEDDHGLGFEAKLPKDDAFVRDRIMPQLRIGSLKGVSIGFRTREDDRTDPGARLIKKAALFEISLVTIPANPAAQVSQVKSLALDDLEGLSDREREARFKELGCSSNLAKRIVAGLRDGGRGGRRDDGEVSVTLPDLAGSIRALAKSLGTP